MQNAEHKEYVLYGGPRVKKHKVTKDELARYELPIGNFPFLYSFTAIR